MLIPLAEGAGRNAPLRLDICVLGESRANHTYPSRCYQEVSEFNFGISKMTKMRAFDTIAVPAKKSGKWFRKRVRRAYLIPRPIDDCNVPPPAKRECLFPCRFRNEKAPVFLDNCVENAGFWDILSAKG